MTIIEIAILGELALGLFILLVILTSLYCARTTKVKRKGKIFNRRNKK